TGASVSDAEVQAAFKNAKPNNHEQRILLFALAVANAKAGSFTTQNVRARAELIGVSMSTVPGSLSKLKGSKLLKGTRRGGGALYSLTAKGKALAERLAEGEVIGGRRGRKPTGPSARAAARVGRGSSNGRGGPGE